MPKAIQLVFVLMIVPLIRLSCTFKSPYNATQKSKLAFLDTITRNTIKSTVP